MDDPVHDPPLQKLFDRNVGGGLRDSSKRERRRKKEAQKEGKNENKKKKSNWFRDKT